MAEVTSATDQKSSLGGSKVHDPRAHKQVKETAVASEKLAVVEKQLFSGHREQLDELVDRKNSKGQLLLKTKDSQDNSLLDNLHRVATGEPFDLPADTKSRCHSPEELSKAKNQLRRETLSGMVQSIHTPNFGGQGWMEQCGSAQFAHMMKSTDPAEYARINADLFTTGKSKLRKDGNTLQINPEVFGVDYNQLKSDTIFMQSLDPTVTKEGKTIRKGGLLAGKVEDHLEALTGNPATTKRGPYFSAKEFIADTDTPAGEKVMQVAEKSFKEAIPQTISPKELHQVIREQPTAAYSLSVNWSIPGELNSKGLHQVGAGGFNDNGEVIVHDPNQQLVKSDDGAEVLKHFGATEVNTEEGTYTLPFKLFMERLQFVTIPNQGMMGNSIDRQIKQRLNAAGIDTNEPQVE